MYDASQKRPRTFTPFTADAGDQPPLRIKFTQHGHASQLLECLQESMRVAKEMGGAPAELTIPGAFGPGPECERSVRLDALTFDGAEELEGGVLVKRLVETDEVLASAMLHPTGLTLIVGAGERSVRLSVSADGDVELICGDDTYVLGRVGPEPAGEEHGALTAAVVALATAVRSNTDALGDVTQKLASTIETRTR